MQSTMTTKTIKDLLKSYQALVEDIIMQQDIYNFYIFLALRKQLTFRRNEVVQINAIFSNSYDGSIFFFNSDLVSDDLFAGMTKVWSL